MTDLKKTDVKNFSRLTREERLNYLIMHGILNKKEKDFLKRSADADILLLLEKLIENAIGCFALPLGIVPDFPMDNKKYSVPMVTEETSVIAAVSKMAKWINQTGKIVTHVHGRDIIGQIQFPTIKNFTVCEKIIQQHSESLIQAVNQKVIPNLVQRGGGVSHFTIRKIARGADAGGGDMLIIHVYMHPCNAMGANLINQLCEFLREPLEKLIQEKANMCILSNLVDSRLTESQVIISLDKNPFFTVIQAEKIAEASLFAQLDHYRAATHNKGIMNGIDSVLIATGNDWRAVEAGMHAYAARSGQYRGLSEWRLENNFLIGKIIAPVIVGTVGGMTQIHPTAQLNLKILNIQQAEELSRIVLSIGLVQNLAAMRALTQEGIVQGHMTLHIANLLTAAGATTAEQENLKPLAAQFLQEKNKITQSDIAALLLQWREKNVAS